jgi:hypothetical protein
VKAGLTLGSALPVELFLLLSSGIDFLFRHRYIRRMMSAIRSVAPAKIRPTSIGETYSIELPIEPAAISIFSVQDPIGPEFFEAGCISGEKFVEFEGTWPGGGEGLFMLGVEGAGEGMAGAGEGGSEEIGNRWFRLPESA